MKEKYVLICAIAIIGLMNNLSAQNRFSDCAAVFLDKKMVVDDYSPKGKCIVDATAKGQLSVYTAVVENDTWRAVDKIAFKITIKDAKTKTLLSYSDVTYKDIDIQKVLSKCQKGDYILISLVKDQYALPHNEILVN